jgi:hypothetical protein
MLKLLSALAVAAFVLVSAPSTQAAPAALLPSLKISHSVVEPVYWRYHRHWHHYRYWRHPVYWRHRHWRYYRYWGPAHRHCGWWW